MGVLVSTLWSRLFSGKTRYKLCIVGLDNAGKTTTLFQLHLDEHVETQPTIGSNVEEVKHKNVLFQVWDLGGQKSLRENWPAYYSGTSAVILVVDSTDRKRLPQVREELGGLLAHPDLAKAALLVFANKQDEKEKMTPAEGCCAKTGVGLYEGIDWVTQTLQKAAGA